MRFTVTEQHLRHVKNSSRRWDSYAWRGDTHGVQVTEVKICSHKTWEAAVGVLKKTRAASLKQGAEVSIVFSRNILTPSCFLDPDRPVEEKMAAGGPPLRDEGGP